jgi:hypothetical protein
MAIIDGLTTLASVKTALGISDSSQDARLEALISGTSSAIKSWLGRDLKRRVVTAEVHAVNFNQVMLLDYWPIVSVQAVRYDGGVVSSDRYSCSAEDAEIGRLYAPYGWTGGMLSRGTFDDPSIGLRLYQFDYTAGYYLPADVGYIAGNVASLPLAVSQACDFAVMETYNAQIRQGQGLQALSEGGLSYTFKGNDTGFLSKQVLAMLRPFKSYRVVV